MPPSSSSSRAYPQPTRSLPAAHYQDPPTVPLNSCSSPYVLSRLSWRRPQVLPESERGIFWSGSAYMVLYSYTVKQIDRSVLYFWKGADVTPLNFLT